MSDMHAEHKSWPSSSATLSPETITEDFERAVRPFHEQFDERSESDTSVATLPQCATTLPSPSASQDHLDSPTTPETPKSGARGVQSLGTLAKASIMLALFFASFINALDRNILATAIPTIAHEFKSQKDIGWYGSAYALTQCGFQLAAGRLYTIYNTKLVYMGSIVLFEAGSALSGAATNSPSFIAGRAVAGIGSAGMYAGSLPIMVAILPLQDRPKWSSLFGIIFGLSSVLGPLLGGAFTDHLTWRWCFYINIPIGAVVVTVLFLELHLPDPIVQKPGMRDLFMRLDIGSLLFFLPAVSSLLLALEWGGTIFSWSNWRLIILLSFSGVLFLIFCVLQYLRGESATMPFRIIANRDVYSGMILGFFTRSAMMVFTFFVPMWFQAIKSASAVESGVMNLPLIIGVVIASLLSGFTTTMIGYYNPWIYLSAILMPIGAGLMTTFTTASPPGVWISYQAIFGLGLGFGVQQPVVVVQSILPKADVPLGAAAQFFAQSLGAAITTSVSNNIFNNKLASDLRSIPDIDSAAVLQSGGLHLADLAGSAVLPVVLRAFNAAIVHAFYVGLAASCILVLGAPGITWKRVKPVKKAKDCESTVEESKGENEIVDEQVSKTAPPQSSGNSRLARGIGNRWNGARDGIARLVARGASFRFRTRRLQSNTGSTRE